ncbi:MAG TPA: M48 family metallopeptidase [Thermodesulfovibrionales bacterium]|nr:M48 family metallopeptidase [Thermodesulfovibrionales bacterium]
MVTGSIKGGALLKASLILVLFIYLVKEGVGYFVEFLNLRYMKKAGLTIPPEFHGKMDEGLMRKTREYEWEKTRFSFISSLFGNIVTIFFIFGGLLDVYNSWIISLRLPFTVSGWAFFLLLSYANDFLSVPFSLYHTFHIENRYGFNTTTLRLWISDFLKSLALSTVITSLVLFAGLWLVQWSAYHWWLWVWIFLVILSIFMMYFSPYVVEPLFNKFTPIEDESLKERIMALTKEAGIHVSRILRIDASRRSRHTNAYFTGIGKTKRIVLYDTLLEGMSHREILTVLAHEIGHWKRHHLLKTMAILEAVSLVALYLCSRLIHGDFLTTLFRIRETTVFAQMVLLAFLGGIIAFPLKPLIHSLMRRHEREADRSSYELTRDAEGMVSAFVMLSKENLSNLNPHPLYVALHYSHPPILDRIRSIRDTARQQNEREGIRGL